jgi:hypothetical protein
MVATATEEEEEEDDALDLQLTLPAVRHHKIRRWKNKKQSPPPFSDGDKNGEGTTMNAASLTKEVEETTTTTTTTAVVVQVLCAHTVHEIACVLDSSTVQWLLDEALRMHREEAGSDAAEYRGTAVYNMSGAIELRLTATLAEQGFTAGDVLMVRSGEAMHA